MTDGIPTETLEALTAFDTPTICNALELVVPERRGHGFSTLPFVCPFPDLGPMIGYAKTARIAARDPHGRSPEANRAIQKDYYAYCFAGPRPALLVIEDIDPQPGIGAFWGEVHTAVHKGMGLGGVITNGSVRDLDCCAKGFRLLAGMVGPSHAHVHVVDHGGPVSVQGMQVADGDIVHADSHGAVVIPAAAVAGLPKAVDLMARRERHLIDAAGEAGFSYERLVAAIARADRES